MMGMTQVQSRTRRQATRRVAQFSCEVVRDEGFSLLGRRVLDVSEEGLRVALEPHVTTGDLQVGELLWVSFRLDAIGLVFDYEAEIARVSPGLRAEDDMPSLGIALTTRWDAGRAYAPALSRLLMRSGIARYRPLVAPSAARGSRSSRVPASRSFMPLHLLEAKP